MFAEFFVGVGQVGGFIWLVLVPDLSPRPELSFSHVLFIFKVSECPHFQIGITLRTEQKRKPTNRKQLTTMVADIICLVLFIMFNCLDRGS